VLHPADRIAWLSVLRAPWCGLYLDDLLALCGQHPQATIWECLTTRLDQPLLFPALSTDAETRLAVVVRKLERVIAAKGRLPLRRLIETAWLSLNGPAGLTPGDLADTEVFFVLLEELDAGGDLIRLEALEERLAKLFAAPDPLAGPDLQLMTIHKAKGLEFDTVILPGLGRSVRSPERPLLLWQELLDPSNRQAGLLLAPIPANDSDSDEPIYRAIARLHAQKDQLETLRLLYVAATRARRRLHLLGHAARNKNGELAPASGSLLKAAWPALAVAAEENTVEAGERMMAATVPGVVLRRLPAGWSMPSPATVPGLAMPVTRRASDAGHREGTGLSLSLRAETGRIVGTVVHQCLEQIARDGAASWSASKLEALRSSLADTLINSGVSRTYVASCVERTVTALVNTLGSIRGRWLLSAHRDATSELALTGIIDGVPVHAVIDRTFVDENGVRWVIDYKTSERGEGEGLEIFLDRERERYRPQLNDYRKLIALQEPQAKVGTALYFPLLDAWCEVE
jgi:ATP-dependent exoDNAse (exonuclease V) beta subunit